MPEPVPQHSDAPTGARVQVLQPRGTEGRNILTDQGTPGRDHPSGEFDTPKTAGSRKADWAMLRPRKGDTSPIIELPADPDDEDTGSIIELDIDDDSVPDNKIAKTAPIPEWRMRLPRPDADGEIIELPADPDDEEFVSWRVEPDSTSAVKGPRRFARHIGRHWRTPAPRERVIGTSGNNIPPQDYVEGYSDDLTAMHGSYDPTTNQPAVPERTAEYNALHSSPEGQPFRRTMLNGWLRATVAERLRGTGRSAHRVFDRAAGTVGLKDVVEKVNSYPPGEYDISSPPSEETHAAIAHEEPAASSVQEVIPERTAGQPEHTPDAVTERNEADLDRPERIRAAWRGFEDLLDSRQGTPADIVSSARHILEVSDYAANTARKLAQDVMYHVRGPEAKAFVEELAQGRIEAVNENAEDVRRELLHIAERTAPLPRLTANVDPVILPNILPQVPDQEKRPEADLSESGLQMRALRGLERGDFSGYQYLPEPVRAELERRQLRPGDANAGDMEAVAQISREGTRFVKPGSDRTPSEPAGIQPPEPASV